MRTNELAYPDATGLEVTEISVEYDSAIDKLIKVSIEVADEHFGPLAATIYDGQGDEVGSRSCCGVVSYRPHANDCIGVRLREAIVGVKAGKS